MYIDDDLSLIRHVAKDNPDTKFFWLETDKEMTLSKLHVPLEKNIVAISQLSKIFPQI